MDSIPRFYAGRAVFITGATGFMGKHEDKKASFPISLENLDKLAPIVGIILTYHQVLVERLLSTCPDIGRIHLLMREKRGVRPEERLAELKGSQLFDGLRASQPQQLDKLMLVAGDVTEAQLGLSQESLAQIKEVSLVFHSAATVRFHEELKVAVDQNLRPVIRLMEICDVLPNVEALVHVSTAYSNAERRYIEEKVYPTPMELQELLEYVDSGTDRTESETLRVISPKPNTYTFTKAMAELALSQRVNRRYPVAIFRPTIVVSSLKHPFPGWVENQNGPTGVIAGASLGLLRVSWTRADAAADLLPVDIAIDTLIAVAWETAIDKSSDVRIYNSSVQDNPCTWRQFQEVLNANLIKYPVCAALWYPHLDIVNNMLIFKFLELLLQTIPHHLIEYLRRLLSFKSRVNLITASEKLRNMNKALSYFSRQEWRFADENVVRLRRRLCEQDRAIYNLDPKTIDWQDHLANFVKGTRKYILKEKDQDFEKARRRMNRLYIRHIVMKLVLLFLLGASLISIAHPFVIHFNGH